MKATDPVSFYAFLDRIDTSSKGQSLSPNKLRTNFIFDAIRTDNFSSNILDDQEAMPLIRVMTTHHTFTEMVGNLPSRCAPKEGDWYLIKLQSKEGGPRAWQAKANNAGAFEEEVGSMRLTEISLLSTDSMKERSSNFPC